MHVPVTSWQGAGQPSSAAGARLILAAILVSDLPGNNQTPATEIGGGGPIPHKSTFFIASW